MDIFHMPQLLGLILVVLLIFGGLAMTGGHGVMHALPVELSLILGAGLGTLIIGNSVDVAKEALRGFVIAFRGPKWRVDDYTALLVLLSNLMRRSRRGGFVSIEQDIEQPETSDAFKAAPSILADDSARTLICDAFRLMALDLSDPARARARMEQSINTSLDKRLKAVAALNTLADALPALGIVAAVLGIIRTMTVIDQSPAVLGAMIATALLGTFLGVFLAYGIVGPVAARFGQIVDDETRLLETIETVLAAFGDGLQPGVAVEMGRSAIPFEWQPSANRVDQATSRARFSNQAREVA